IRVADVSVARHLYRIAQEAVYNAVKHSKGSRIRIGLHRRNGQLVLSVRDNGVGFSAEAIKGSDMGLHIMNYRARMIGATLDVRRGKSRGTVVTCSMKRPVAEKKEKRA